MRLGGTIALVLTGTALGAQDGIKLSTAEQRLVDEWKCKATAWAAEPTILAAVASRNRDGPIDGMTEKRWRRTRAKDPLIRALRTNAAAARLRDLVTATGNLVSEAFVCTATGHKAAFLTKTTRYDHTGRAKFDVPFRRGTTWQGPAEFDESTQTYAVQIAVPILTAEPASPATTTITPDIDSAHPKPPAATDAGKKQTTNALPTRERIGVLVLGLSVARLRARAAESTPAPRRAPQDSTDTPHDPAPKKTRAKR